MMKRFLLLLLLLTPMGSGLAQTPTATVSPTQALANAINAVRVVEKRVPLTIQCSPYGSGGEPCCRHGGAGLFRP